jgi:hypothetical protein
VASSLIGFAPSPKRRGAAAEQHRGHVHLQLVHEPGSQRLLNRRGAARDQDLAVARGGTRLLDS